MSSQLIAFTIQAACRSFGICLGLNNSAGMDLLELLHSRNVPQSMIHIALTQLLECTNLESSLKINHTSNPHYEIFALEPIVLQSIDYSYKDRKGYIL